MKMMLERRLKSFTSCFVKVFILLIFYYCFSRTSSDSSPYQSSRELKRKVRHLWPHFNVTPYQWGTVPPHIKIDFCRHQEHIAIDECHECPTTCKRLMTCHQLTTCHQPTKTTCSPLNKTTCSPLNKTSKTSNATKQNFKTTTALKSGSATNNSRNTSTRKVNSQMKNGPAVQHMPVTFGNHSMNIGLYSLIRGLLANNMTLNVSYDGNSKNINEVVNVTTNWKTTLYKKPTQITRQSSVIFPR